MRSETKMQKREAPLPSALALPLPHFQRTNGSSNSPGGNQIHPRVPTFFCSLGLSSLTDMLNRRSPAQCVPQVRLPVRANFKRHHTVPHHNLSGLDIPDPLLPFLRSGACLSADVYLVSSRLCVNALRPRHCTLINEMQVFVRVCLPFLSSSLAFSFPALLPVAHPAIRLTSQFMHTTASAVVSRHQLH